ncbi:hypothetical protein HWV62_18880 [Athelia sp. TMB]|nr:hypothetical protein HWV62_18880 [Athelia sp. TMB]
MKQLSIPLEKVCLLDPKAKEVLSPQDGDGAFEWFIYCVHSNFSLTRPQHMYSDSQGILGDDPLRDRTSELRALGFPTRHLGPVQMTIDTALGVSKIVVADKIKLDAIPYIVGFSGILRYMKEKKEPRHSPGMRELLREDLNKSFEF